MKHIQLVDGQQLFGQHHAAGATDLGMDWFVGDIGDRRARRLAAAPEVTGQGGDDRERDDEW